MKDGKHTQEEMALAYRMMRGLMPMREQAELRNKRAEDAAKRRADKMKKAKR
jgi:hypothetical protein